MSMTAVLEIVISLAALYWLLSSGCSFVVEAANSMLMNLRAKALERFVCELILGSGKVKGLRSFLQFWRRSLLDRIAGVAQPNLADPLGIFSHGLVEALRKPQVMPGLQSSGPSYMPARIFAQALLDRLGSLAWITMGGAKPTDAELSRIPPLGEWNRLLADIAAKTGEQGFLQQTVSALLGRIATKSGAAAIADLELLAKGLRDWQPADPALVTLRQGMLGVADSAVDFVSRLPGSVRATQKPLAEFVTGEAFWLAVVRAAGESFARQPSVPKEIAAVVAHLPLPASLRETLRPILSEANFDLAKLREGLETWYDAAMDRASGWFRRHTTMALCVVGMAVAVVFNVNSIAITADLARDPSVRAAGVASAESIVNNANREHLAQQWTFKNRAAQRDWESRLKEVADSAQGGLDEAQLELLRGLTLAIRPALLTSGAYAGVALQVLAGEARLERGEQQWAGDKEREALLKAICRARLSAAERQSTGPSRGAVIDDKRIDGTELGKLAECSEVAKEFADWKEPEEVYRQFWNSSTIAWAPTLAVALLDLRLAATRAGKAPTEEQRKALAAKFESTRAQLVDAIKKAEQATEKIEGFLDRLPSLGRNDAASARGFAWWFPKGGLHDLAGWFITALMVSFGAPFWFDLMNKLVDRRATGPRPDGRGST